MSTIELPGSPFPFSAIVVFGWIAFFLLMGMLLRYKIPFFRKYLIPACILGGLLGLAMRSLGFFSLIGAEADSGLFQAIVFHLFNLTWVFLGLKIPNKATPDKVSGHTQSNLKMVFLILFANVFVVGLMGGFGALSTYLLKLADLNSGPSTIGFITSLAFTGGPGQALTASAVWTQSSTYLGVNDFALATSSAGYLVAIIVGIPLVNIIARRKKLTTLTDPNLADQDGFYDFDCAPSSCKDTTVSTNIDTLAFHLSLGLFAYFLLIFLLNILIPFLPVATLPLIWGVFYLFCFVGGFIVRTIIKALKKDFICCNQVNNKISNSLVDLLVCGTFISVQLGEINTYVLPFLASTITISVICAVACWFIFGKLKHEGPEYFAFTFGTWTGTISTGLILSRMVDPENKSSVAVNFGVANAFMIPIVVVLTFLIHMEVVYNYPPIYAILGCLAFSLVSFIGLKLLKYEKSKKLWQTEE